jgi:hypothetical protein
VPPHAQAAASIQAAQRRRREEKHQRQQQQQQQQQQVAIAQAQAQAQQAQAQAQMAMMAQQQQQAAAMAQQQAQMAAQPPPQKGPPQQGSVYPSGHPRFMAVTVPAGVGPGGQFAVNTPAGQQLVMTCPPGVMPGQHVNVPLPDPAPPALVVQATPAALPTCGVASAPAPVAAAAAVPPQDLYGFLVAQRCEAYHAALQGLGAQVPQDLKDMEDADFDAVGMKLLEKKRLIKALATV